MNDSINLVILITLDYKQNPWDWWKIPLWLITLSLLMTAAWRRKKLQLSR